MNSLILVIFALIGYLLAYRFYGRHLPKQILFSLTISRQELDLDD